MMKGKPSVMYSATSADARHGTVMVELPARMERMCVLAKGVRVIEVSSPAQQKGHSASNWNHPRDSFLALHGSSAKCCMMSGLSCGSPPVDSCMCLMKTLITHMSVETEQ